MNDAMSQASLAPARRCAVIYNPTKVSDEFQQLVAARLERDGWTDTLWLETSADDPGRGMTKEAVAARVDLVIGAGGDGTVRVVADGLAGSGIPMGLVPAGTANLLARNLDLPLEEDAAADIAFAGHTWTIDLIKLTVDDRPPEHFAVIAGIGVDAMIMDETDPDLKDKLGSAAYFLAAAKALDRSPIRLTVQLDHHRPVKRRAMICAIANVGELPGNHVNSRGSTGRRAARPVRGLTASMAPLGQTRFAPDHPSTEEGRPSRPALVGKGRQSEDPW
jgi:diacylglycerol kinase (ATP)